MNPQALDGIRVLDLSRILAGPTAAQLLGDFGAEVIKIERPGKGDDARRLGGAVLRAQDGSPTDFAPMYVCANRNKKSMCVDFTKPEGADIVRRLVEAGAGVESVMPEERPLEDVYLELLNREDRP